MSLHRTQQDSAIADHETASRRSPKSGTAARSARVAARLRESSPTILVFVALLVIWELIALRMQAADVPLAEMKLAAPHEIVARILSQIPFFASTIRVTAMGALIGLLGGTLTGVAVALLVSQARWLEGALHPYIIGGQMIPIVALAPILLAATRNPTLTRALIATEITFFPVSVATLKGLKSTPHAALDLMRSYNASRPQVYWRVRVPGAVPFFFAGLKIAAPLAVVGEIVVELTGANSGLGYTILASQYYGLVFASQFWAATVLTLTLGIVFYLGAVALERILSPWQSEFRKG